MTSRTLKKHYRTRRTLCAVSVLALLAASCTVGSAEDEDVGAAQDALMGHLDDDDVDAALRDFNADVVFFARAVAASPAFRECVGTAISSGVPVGPIAGGSAGPYMLCAGDPVVGLSDAQLHELMMQVVRSNNDLDVASDTGSGQVSTGQNDGLLHQNAEGFGWHGWFSTIFSELDEPLCADTGGVKPCRFAPYPWPYSQTAGFVIHEASHTHGFGHGDNTQNGPALVACNQSAPFHFQTNTMPYLIQKCAVEVIERSHDLCGSIDACGDGELNLVESFDATSCGCVQDRRFADFGAVDMSASGMSHHSIRSVGQSLGGWRLGVQNQIPAFVDFDGNGSDDFVVRSDWGLGVLTDSGGGFWTLAIQSFASSSMLNPDISIVATGNFDTDEAQELLARDDSGLLVIEEGVNDGFSVDRTSWGKRLPGGWTLGKSDSYYQAANFDGFRGDEVVVRSGWGLGILGISTSGHTTLAVAQHGTTIGAWTLDADDEIAGIGDFDGDGEADILLRSASGMAVVHRSGSTFSASGVQQYGQAVNGWYFDADDEVAAVGRFGSDAKDQIFIRGSSSVAVLGYNGSAFFAVKFSPYNTFWGGWRLSVHDRVEGVGDFDDDGRDDFVLRSDWGIGVLSTGTGATSTANTKSVVRYGDSYGDWTLGAGDVVIGSADIDGDGKDGLLLRN